MARDQVQTDMTDLARRMQSLFNVDGAGAPQVARMMELQQEMFRQTETFARHWLERRQDAAETGLEALREIGSTSGSDPMAAMRAITEWQRGSFKRLNADLQEWVEICTHAAQLPQPQDTAATPKDTAQATTTKAKGQTASKAKAEHATPV
ncbi:phasin family protein [Roseovarius sp. D22-M7]|uniref:phasin family protein n=1 Tax=Roseovarius sp. D22-M7 TaxID=3127116 RepID=UPI00300FF01E